MIISNNRGLNVVLLASSAAQARGGAYSCAACSAKRKRLLLKEVAKKQRRKLAISKHRREDGARKHPASMLKNVLKKGGEQCSAVLLAVQRCAHLPQQSQVAKCIAQRQQRRRAPANCGSVKQF
jgi:hypothetical protein